MNHKINRTFYFLFKISYQLMRERRFNLYLYITCSEKNDNYWKVKHSLKFFKEIPYIKVIWTIIPACPIAN